jgi:hypothetical protein
MDEASDGMQTPRYFLLVRQVCGEADNEGIELVISHDVINDAKTSVRRRFYPVPATNMSAI